MLSKILLVAGVANAAFTSDAQLAADSLAIIKDSYLQLADASRKVFSPLADNCDVKDYFPTCTGHAGRTPCSGDRKCNWCPVAGATDETSGYCDTPAWECQGAKGGGCSGSSQPVPGTGGGGLNPEDEEKVGQVFQKCAEKLQGPAVQANPECFDDKGQPKFSLDFNSPDAICGNPAAVKCLGTLAETFKKMMTCVETEALSLGVKEPKKTMAYGFASMADMMLRTIIPAFKELCTVNPATGKSCFTSFEELSDVDDVDPTKEGARKEDVCPMFRTLGCCINHVVPVMETIKNSLPTMGPEAGNDMEEGLKRIKAFIDSCNIPKDKCGGGTYIRSCVKIANPTDKAEFWKKLWSSVREALKGRVATINEMILAKIAKAYNVDDVRITLANVEATEEGLKVCFAIKATDAADATRLAGARTIDMTDVANRIVQMAKDHNTAIANGSTDEPSTDTIDPSLLPDTDLTDVAGEADKAQTVEITEPTDMPNPYAPEDPLSAAAKASAFAAAAAAVVAAVVAF